jgi:hypothetical protein
MRATTDMFSISVDVTGLMAKLNSKTIEYEIKIHRICFITALPSRLAPGRQNQISKRRKLLASPADFSSSS